MSKLGLSKKLYALLSLGVATSFTASCACSANAGVENLQVNYNKDTFSSSINPFSPLSGTDMSYGIISLAEFEGWNISYNNNKGSVLNDADATAFKNIFDDGRSGKDNNGQPWLALRWIGADKPLVMPTWTPKDPKDSTKGGNWAPHTANSDPKKVIYTPEECYKSLHDNSFYAVFDFAKYSDGKANWVNPVQNETTSATLASFTTGLKLTFSFANIAPSYFAAPASPENDASWTASNTDQSKSGMISLPSKNTINFLLDKYSSKYNDQTTNFFFTGDANIAYTTGAKSLLTSATWTPLS